MKADTICCYYISKCWTYTHVCHCERKRKGRPRNKAADKSSSHVNFLGNNALFWNVSHEKLYVTNVKTWAQLSKEKTLTCGPNVQLIAMFTVVLLAVEQSIYVPSIGTQLPLSEKCMHQIKTIMTCVPNMSVVSSLPGWTLIKTIVIVLHFIFRVAHIQQLLQLQLATQYKN